jgi:hypothetical protein
VEVQGSSVRALPLGAEAVAQTPGELPGSVLSF